jgi:hypothetical protein
MRKKLLIVTFFLLTAALLSGCTGATVWPGLAASTDTAYLANTTAVHALDLKTGQEFPEQQPQHFCDQPGADR